MGKRASKRPKMGKETVTQIQPLGTHPSLLDDAAKDDEERRLESMLFGTNYVPAPQDSSNILVVSDEENGEVDAGKELQNLTDTDVRLLISRYFIPV